MAVWGCVLEGSLFGNFGVDGAGASGLLVGRGGAQPSIGWFSSCLRCITS